MLKNVLKRLGRTIREARRKYTDSLQRQFYMQWLFDELEDKQYKKKC